MEELLDEFNDIFSDDPGCTARVEHCIKTGDSQPVYRPPYRIPHAWQRQKCRTCFGQESSESAPVVPVKKKDGSLRLCVDYRNLNSVDELLEKLGKSTYITTLDLTKGYYQVHISREDQLPS